MDAPQGNGHAPDINRDRIAPAEDAAVGDLDACAFLDPERAQAARFLGDERRPVDRDDARALADWEEVECDGGALPDRSGNCKLMRTIRNNLIWVKSGFGWTIMRSV